MDVERVIVRILADTSGYFRHMAMAEAGLARFGNTAAAINARSNAAVQQVTAGFERTRELATQRHATTMTKLHQQQTAGILAAHKAHHDAVQRAQDEHDRRMLAANQLTGRARSTARNAVLKQLIQDKRDADAAFTLTTVGIRERFAGKAGRADELLGSAISEATYRRDARLQAIERMRKEALEDAQARQKALADAHFLSARARFIQGAVVGGAALGAVGLGFAAYASKLALEYERISLAFEVMMGSAGAGQKLLRDIEQLALRTPFKSQELAKYGKELMAFGVTADNIVPTLEALGNVAAGTGGDMGRITLAFGQVMTAGRLMGQELRQFTNAGIPVLEYLSKVLGKPVDQVRQMVHRGDVSAQAVVRAFNMMTQEGGRFAGLMDRLNTEKVSGRIENLVEKIQMNARSFALAAFEGLGLVAVLDSISEGTNQVDQGRVAEVFKNIAEGIRTGYGHVRDFFHWIGRTIQSVYEWVAANQRLANGLGVVIGLFVTLSIVTRTLATTLFILRVMVVTFNAITMAVKIATGMIVVMTAITKLLTVATYSQAAASAVAWVAALGPIGLIIGLMTALLVVMTSLGYYKGFGAEFAEGWERFGKSFQVAWRGMMAAFETGDMGLVFDIAWETMQLGFKGMLLGLGIEWAEFWKQAFGFVMSLIPSIAIALVAGLTVGIARMYKLVGELLLEIPGAKDAGRNIIRGAEDMEAKVIAGGNARIDELQKFFATLAPAGLVSDYLKRQKETFGAGNRNRIAELTQQAELNAMLTPDARSVAEFVRNVQKMPLDQQKATIAATKMAPADTNPAFAAFGGGPVVPTLQQQYSDKWLDMTGQMMTVIEMQRAGRQGTPEFQLAVEKANRLSREFHDLAAAMDKANRAANGMKTQFEISARSKDYVAELMNVQAKGTHPMEVFQNNMALLNEAIGPFGKPADEVGGVSGFMQNALKEKFGPDIMGIIGKDMWRKGAVMEYDKLRRALDTNKESLPPAQLYGTTGAQETINRAKRDQVNDADRIIKTISIGNILLKESRDFDEKIAEEMVKLNKGGVFNIKLGKLDGAGN